MFLRNLELNNFRNISKVTFDFDKNINIFIGNNAQGKTNILESIYFLAITRSHRTHNELNLIKKEELYTKVSGIFDDDTNNIHSLSILLNEKGKKVSVDNLVQKRISNYLSRLNVIMFCPDDLEIIKGSPSVRRKFLNIELSQFRNDYVLLLKEYNQVLKQRNEYLKQKQLKTELDSYIGYTTLYVANKDYLKALTYGSMYAMKNKELNICWVSPDSTRMHNIDDLAVLSKKCALEKKFLNKTIVETLATLRYSTNPNREFDDDEFDLNI